MRILVTIGGTTHSDKAVLLGNLIHQMTGGILTIFTVVRNEKQQARAEISLGETRKLIDTADSQIQTRIRVGQPAESIVIEAASGEYDLMIIGERTRNRFLRRLRAPIAERVIARVPCPVMIARGRPRPFRRILACDSGHHPTLINDLTQEMYPLIQKVEKLTVLHVMSQIAAGPGVPGWELRADAEELIHEHTPEGVILEEGVARLERLNIHPEAKVRHGLVVREILSEARSGNYDLVVIGAHPEIGWEHFLLDDLAREIINQIDRPLLVIRR